MTSGFLRKVIKNSIIAASNRNGGPVEILLISQEWSVRIRSIGGGHINSPGELSTCNVQRACQCFMVMKQVQELMRLF